MKVQPNYTKINHIKSQKNPNYPKRQKKFHKSKSIKDDVPDALYNSNSLVKRSEKLTSTRKNKLHMSQLGKNVDIPDILFGFDEYKEIRMFKDTHYTKKLRASSLSPDPPDVLEPVKEIYMPSMPKPYKIIEESKNPEITENDYKKEEFLKEIKEEKEEKKEEEKDNNVEIEKDHSEEKKDEIPEDKLEELKKLEEEKQKIEKEKNELEAKKKFEEDQKKLDEEKRLEEQKRY